MPVLASSNAAATRMLRSSPIVGAWDRTILAGRWEDTSNIDKITYYNVSGWKIDCSIQPWNRGVRVFDQIRSEEVRVRVVGRGTDFFAWS